MKGTATLAALRKLQDADCDAIAMLGTGMATLEPMVAVRGWDGPVPLSCNVALIWALVEASSGRELTRDIAGDFRSECGRLTEMLPARVRPHTTELATEHFRAVELCLEVLPTPERDAGHTRYDVVRVSGPDAAISSDATP